MNREALVKTSHIIEVLELGIRIFSSFEDEAL